jgi:hypothetical protein
MSRLRIVMVAVATLVALTACATPVPGVSPDPTVSPTPTPTASEPAAEGIDVDVYFSHLQPTRTTLISERRVVLVEPGADPVVVVLGALIDGTLVPSDPDYATLWGAGSRLNSASREGERLTVDLSVGALNVGAEAEGIAIAQVVWTATGLDPAISDVRFTVDGARVETLAGHVDLTVPFARGAPESVLSPLHIAQPTEGASVTNPVAAAGVACVFEAAFTWRLDGPDGVVAEGSAMADSACPDRAVWRIELGTLTAGEYELTVIEYSAADGSLASSDSKRFTVAD